MSWVCIPFIVQLGCDLLPFEVVETEVGSHAPNPRAELALDVKGVDAIIGADKNFLREILRLAALVQNAVTNIEDARLVTRDKLAKCLRRVGVAATGAQDQVAVSRRSHG